MEIPDRSVFHNDPYYKLMLKGTVITGKKGRIISTAYVKNSSETLVESLLRTAPSDKCRYFVMSSIVIRYQPEVSPRIKDHISLSLLFLKGKDMLGPDGIVTIATRVSDDIFLEVTTSRYLDIRDSGKIRSLSIMYNQDSNTEGIKCGYVMVYIGGHIVERNLLRPDIKGGEIRRIIVHTQGMREGVEAVVYHDTDGTAMLLHAPLYYSSGDLQAHLNYNDIYITQEQLFNMLSMFTEAECHCPDDITPANWAFANEEIFHFYDLQNYHADMNHLAVEYNLYNAITEPL